MFMLEFLWCLQRLSDIAPPWPELLCLWALFLICGTFCCRYVVLMGHCLHSANILLPLIPALFHCYLAAIAGLFQCNLGANSVHQCKSPELSGWWCKTFQMWAKAVCKERTELRVKCWGWHRWWWLEDQELWKHVFLTTHGRVSDVCLRS